MRVTIVDLAKLTGLDRHTVTARLARANLDAEPDSPGNSRQYESARALPALYHAPLSSVEALRQRRGELLAAQTERAQHELKKELAGYVTREQYAADTLELLSRTRTYVQSVPNLVAQFFDLNPVAHYQLQRMADETLDGIFHHLGKQGDSESWKEALARKRALFDAIKTIEEDPLLENPDFLERFSNAPYGHFKFRISVDPPRWAFYDLALLEHLLELKRQLEALQLTVPQDVLQRIDEAERGWLAPGHPDVAFGKKNRDGTPVDAAPAT